MLILVVGLAVVAGAAAVMRWSNRIQRRRIERSREAWKAMGGIGPCPGGDYDGLTGLGQSN